MTGSARRRAGHGQLHREPADPDTVDEIRTVLGGCGHVRPRSNRTASASRSAAAVYALAGGARRPVLRSTRGSHFQGSDPQRGLREVVADQVVHLGGQSSPLPSPGGVGLAFQVLDAVPAGGTQLGVPAAPAADSPRHDREHADSDGGDDCRVAGDEQRGRRGRRGAEHEDDDAVVLDALIAYPV